LSRALLRAARCSDAQRTTVTSCCEPRYTVRDCGALLLTKRYAHMPMYRGGLDRYSKWSAKFVPETVAARFTQVREVALERGQLGLLYFGTVDDLVRPVLDKRGITGPARALYLAFAKKLARHLVRHRGDAASKIAAGLKAEWVTAFGADPAIIDEIIGVVGAGVAPY